ncbi:hypothetical protein [Bacillus wiedmannii]
MGSNECGSIVAHVTQSCENKLFSLLQKKGSGANNEQKLQKT